MGHRGPIVVTGATGFIGRHVVESLALERTPVRAVTRRAAVFPAGVGVSVIKDLSDREALRRAVTGASAVIHLAGRAHARREAHADASSECRRINVDGTAVLLEECAAAGIRKFVFASSVKAVASQSDVALTADTPPMPGDAYGESKLEAERLIKVVAAREGISAALLRLPVVYGAGMKANMAALFKAVDRGLPLPLASVSNRRSFAYVGNVVGALKALVDAPIDGSRVAYVSDESDLSTPGLIREIGVALGRKPRLVPMPVGLLSGAGRIGGLLSRIAGLHFSNESVIAVLGSLFVDTSSLREMTGFIPPYSVGQGLSLTAASLRSGGRG
jgi:nucleoside-diphosphate-sugar epimerase